MRPVPNSEKDKAPGILTRKILERWCSEHKQRYAHSIRTWSRFVSSESEILDKFLSFPQQVQMILVCETVTPYDVTLLTKYFNLLQIAERDHPESELRADITGTYKVRQLCEDYPEIDTEDFKKEYAVFIESDLPRKDNIWREYFRTIPGIFKVLYGADVALEMMRGWSRSQETVTMYDLILIAENCEKFQDYPFEWALSLVQTGHEEVARDWYGNNA